MTRDEAQQIAWSFKRMEVVIEHVEIRAVADGNYIVVVDRVDGEQQIFKDVTEAGWAAAYAVRDQMLDGDLFATLGENATPIPCDFQTHMAWVFPNVEKTKIKIACSPDVEATISFSGHSPAEVSMTDDRNFGR